MVIAKLHNHEIDLEGELNCCKAPNFPRGVSQKQR